MNAIEVDRIINHHGRGRASLLAILQDIQDTYNWISEDHLRQVAHELELPESQVYSVATFYRALSLEPRGKTIINVCKGTSCHVRGAQLIQEELERQLEIGVGETTPDLEYTLQVVNCVGACAMAPVVLVDGEYHAQVKPHKAGKLLKRKGAEE